MATNSILDIFNLSDSDLTLDLNSKKESELYNPKPEGKETYSAIIRFLPIPVMEDGKLKGVEQEPWYMKQRYFLRDSSNMGTYFDSPTTIDEKCPISATYFRLKNSDNVLDKKRAEDFKRNTHFWSLIYIIDDKKNPNLNGKIKIFRYSSEIQEKIKTEYDKRKIKVWDLFKGKDFDLTITNKKVTLPNGDSREFPEFVKSEFLNESPLVYKGKALDKSNPTATSAVIDEIYSIAPNIGEFKYKPWTVEEKAQLDKILDRYKSKEEQSNTHTESKMSANTTVEDDSMDETDGILKTLGLQ